MAFSKNSRVAISKQKKEAFDRICEAIAKNLNIDFIESTWINEPRGFVITAYIDKFEGINLDDCEAFHRELIKKTDAYEYDFLEVSSLGADRPIKSRRDFERFAGSMVELKLFTKQDGKKSFIGKITDYTDAHAQIETGQEVLTFEHKNIALIKPYIDVEAEVGEVDLGEEIE